MASKDKHLVIVRSVLQQGLTPTAAAARYGVSRQWVHTLLNRYQAEGPDGLAPRSRAPKSRPITTSEPLRRRIIELREDLIAQGADAQTLARRPPTTSHAHRAAIPA